MGESTNDRTVPLHPRVKLLVNKAEKVQVDRALSVPVPTGRYFKPYAGISAAATGTYAARNCGQ